MPPTDPSADHRTEPVLVMGAGAIGCFVGGRLAASGVPVHLVGRPRVLDALRRHGLTLSDLEAPSRTLAAQALSLHGSCAGLSAGLVLLTVKSGATDAAARELAATLPPGTPVLSLQNGIGNADAAQRAAPELACIAGMVPFNVAEQGPGHYHRGTSGVLAAQDHPALHAWRDAFERAGLPLALHADLRAVLWAKLLLNLNNPVNALSGLPLRAQLLDRGYRRVLAALQDEALGALAAAGIVPAKLTPLPPGLVPRVLRLPTPLFRVVAARMLKIDERARSSMADDLALGRPTEVDALCGEVARLAASTGGAAPLNEHMVRLVQAWPQRPQPMPSAELQQRLGLA